MVVQAQLTIPAAQKVIERLAEQNLFWISFKYRVAHLSTDVVGVVQAAIKRLGLPLADSIYQQRRKQCKQR